MISSSISARLQIVDEHIRLENAHDLAGILRTFGASARYDDEPWGAHYVGHGQVRAYYEELLRAIPDLRIDMERRHTSDESVVVEVRIRGRHLGPWRGLPATGYRLDFPLCGIFTFDAADRLAGERIYYDRATVLQQIGVFHDPESAAGRVVTALSHPLTMARIAMQSVWKRGSRE
ncbi:MAG TPA: ester cyclase [Xanthobacteraceae bacterium]|nr:ester cyclase [Xanthobacteraceae bacterium]